MKVNEIFTTIQGEGPRLGIPSVFVRLAGCNLSCWWCDTKYTWMYTQKRMDSVINKMQMASSKKQFGLIQMQQANRDIKIYDKKEESKFYTSEELFLLVKNRIQGTDIENIVITGGEPLLQSQEVFDFIAGLHRFNKYIKIEIETNGTIPLDPIDIAELDDRFFLNVSPKLENSLNSKDSRYDKELLKEFSEFPNTTFKFVVSGIEDIVEIEQILRECFITTDKVILMPEGTTRARLQETTEQLVNFCIENGYRFTPRLHINIWDNKRGV